MDFKYSIPIKKQGVQQKYISELLDGGKWISNINERKIYSNPPVKLSIEKNLRAEGWPSPPLSAKHMQYICEITLLQI